MNNTHYLVYAVLVFFITLSCTPKHAQNRQAKPFNKGLTVQLFINNNKIEGATVGFEKLVGLTDKNGKVSFDVPNRKIGKEGQIYIKYEGANIDTIFILRITNFQPIYIESLKGPLQVLSGRPEERQKSLKDINAQITVIKDLITQSEEDLNNYLAQHPNSALVDFQKAIKYSKDNLESLTEKITILYNNYDEVLVKLDEGDIIDIGPHEENFNKIKKLYNQFRNNATRINSTLNGQIAVIPDEELLTDIFFGFRKFRWLELSDANKQIFTDYINKIQQTKDNIFPYDTLNNLLLKVKVVGYTDGVPVVTDSLSNLIIPLCESINFEYTDLNECLSFLRANEIAEYMGNHLPEFTKIMEVDGKGNSLAIDNLKNAKLRKCILSFSLIHKNDLPNQEGVSHQLEFHKIEQEK